MKASGIGHGGRFAAVTCLLLATAAPSFGARPGQEEPVPLTGPVEIADAERAFAALDADAGIRSGGAFPFDYQHLAYFPSVSEPGQTVDLWTAVSVQADRVKPVFEQGWKYELEMRVELSRADSLAYSGESRLTYTRGSPLSPVEAAKQGFPVQVLLRVAPGEYDYRIRIRDAGWEEDRSVNQVTGTIRIPPPIRSQPFVSSIAVAADSGGTWRPAADLELKLNAARIVQRGARPFVYFEAYGLTPGGDYRGEVRLVSRRESAARVSAPGVQPFQMQYRGSVPDDPSRPVRKVIRLDLGQTKPGPYEVQVRVRDLVTGAASEVRTAQIKVRVDGAQRPLMPVADGDR